MIKKLDNIYGNNVYLRPIEFADTNLIVTWRNNPRVKQNFIFQENFTYSMHEKWMKTKVLTGEVVQYIIIEKKSGKPVGSVYYRDINNNNRSAEYGIFIGDDNMIGKGYGTETAKLFIDFGFKKLGLHRISLRVLDNNKPAYKSYVSAGFKIEGVFRDMEFINGKYVNIIFMSILESDI